MGELSSTIGDEAPLKLTTFALMKVIVVEFK